MDWLSLPPLSALRAFCAYAETGSVTLAGTALNVSHAAISQQIRKLEDRLGLALVDRGGRQMRLTAEGRQLAHALGEGFGTIAQTVAALTNHEADRPILVSATPSFASGWLMPRLSGFREAHPDISLTIDPSVEVKSLQPGGVDVALRYGAGQWPGLEAVRLIRSPVVVVAQPALIGDRQIASAAELGYLPWLQEYGTSETTDWMARQGVVRRASHALTALPGNLLLEAARQGQGVAIAPRVFVEDDIAAGRLRLLFEADLHKGYYMVTRPGPQRPALKAFTRWLRRQADQKLN